MSGPVGLHGGAEFLAGDEPFLRALLQVVTPRVQDRPLRVVMLPTAAAGEHPDKAAAMGTGAFERVAADLGIVIETTVARAVDAASANDDAIAGRLEAADLVFLPGGDPGIVPAILAGSRAWQAAESANAAGAVVAGASAGAMGLAPWTWGPSGIRPGLGLVPGLVVVPHYASFDPARWQPELDRAADLGLGVLGLDERTGVISDGDPARPWRVAGEGRASWSPPGSAEPVVARHGELLDFALRP